MFIPFQNHSHTHIDKNNYYDILEIIGFSTASFILGILYQKLCNGTRIN